MTIAVYADRVKETTTTSGTGTVSLAGAVSGYQSFGSAFTNGQVVGYCLVDGNNWEVGYGTWSTGNNLARTTVLASTNSNTQINLSGGTTSVFCTMPADFVTKTSAGKFGSQAATTPVSVTFSATPTIDCSTSNVFYMGTMTANITSLTLSNPTDGQTISIEFTQDGTGSRTLAMPASFKWSGGTAGVLTTAANAVDVLIATWRASTSTWRVALQRNFA